MKRYVIPLLIGLVCLGFGSCYVWFEITDFSFINQIPERKFLEKQDTYEFAIEEGGNYRIIGSDSIVTLETSEELTDKIVVNVSYYPDFTSIKYYQNSFYENKPMKNIVFHREDDHAWNTLKNMKQVVLDDLKDKTLHNYNLLVQPRIVVVVPVTQKERVVIISGEDEMVEFFDEDE